ncbi:porin [Shewanella colwelliana]|uniref:porin n=1 Tax=Shewanella colwelliana TaxID=23 RepID=UPI003736EA32
MLSIFTSAAMAEADLKVSGFGTLGGIYNDNDTLNFHRAFTLKATDTAWSWKSDSLIGVQLNANLDEKFDAVGQLVLKDRVSDHFSDNIELLFMRYRPTRDWYVRLGRTHAELYMLSEYRNVGYGYLWARPIPEFYAFSSSISQVDGVDVGFSRRVAGGLLDVKLGYGKSNAVFEGLNTQFEIDLEDVWVFTSQLTFEAWSLRLAAAQAEVDSFTFKAIGLVDELNQVPSNLWPQASTMANDLTPEGQILNYFALGATYDSDSWVFQSEIGYMHSDWSFLQSFYSGYASIGYRFGDATLYGVVAHIENQNPPLSYPAPNLPPEVPPELSGGISELYGDSQWAINLNRVHQSSFSLGVRWDFYPNNTLKFQWDNINVEEGGTALWSHSFTQEIDTQVNLFSINYSFIFSL